MATLTEERIAELLLPYTQSLAMTVGLIGMLSRYIDLVMLWNARTNLTAVRDPELLVQRQIGESLFAARLLPESTPSLLDFGSGAGFPGIPLQLLRPEVRVTLAESQGKKASFLREAVRQLGLQSRVWAGRAEDFADKETFDCVAMRAVDHAERMLPIAQKLVASGGMLLRFYGTEPASLPPGWLVRQREELPTAGGWEALVRQ